MISSWVLGDGFPGESFLRVPAGRPELEGRVSAELLSPGSVLAQVIRIVGGWAVNEMTQRGVHPPSRESIIICIMFQPLKSISLTDTFLRSGHGKMKPPFRVPTITITSNDCTSSISFVVLQIRFSSLVCYRDACSLASQSLLEQLYN